VSRLAHKRGRPSNYRKQLKGDYWEEVKRQVRVRDGHKCVCCYELIGLETHHITYYMDGISIVGKELDHLEWMALVCEECHTKIHRFINHKLNPKNPHKLNINQWKIQI